MQDRKTGETIRPFGYDLDDRGVPFHARVDMHRAGDHGSDPLPNGRFRMIPSGDVVDFEERNRRLKQ